MNILLCYLMQAYFGSAGVTQMHKNTKQNKIHKQQCSVR